MGTWARERNLGPFWQIKRFRGFIDKFWRKESDGICSRIMDLNYPLPLAIGVETKCCHDNEAVWCNTTQASEEFLSS